MKFSIIMPVLNGARFISHAIESITAQSCTDWELIIIDGGSTDDTQAIAAKFSQTDTRIRCRSEADRGMYDGLFKGFADTQGEWIGWLNCDDLYAPWALGAVKTHLSKNNSQWLTGLPGCWDDKGVLRYVRPAARYSQQKIAAGWHHEGLLGYLQQESMFFSRRLLDQLTPEEVERIRTMRLAGDFLLWRAFAAHAPLDVIPTTLGGFRRHEQNRSAQHQEAYRQEVASTNPHTMPAFLAQPYAALWRLASAWEAVRRADKADRQLIAATQDNINA